MTFEMYDVKNFELKKNFKITKDNSDSSLFRVHFYRCINVKVERFFTVY